MLGLSLIENTISLLTLDYHLYKINIIQENHMLDGLCCFIYSLKSMFDSPHFKENLTSFQQLLREGVFDVSFPGTAIEDCKTLKRLVLWHSSKSKWVEHYHQLKVRAGLMGIRFLFNENTGKKILNMHFNRVLCTCRNVKIVAKDLLFPVPTYRCRVTS